LILFRSGPVRSGRVGSGRVGSGPVGSGLVGSGQVRSGPVGSDNGNSDNRAKSAQFKVKLPIGAELGNNLCQKKDHISIDDKSY
jgi:hypothetical protein